MKRIMTTVEPVKSIKVIWTTLFFILLPLCESWAQVTSAVQTTTARSTAVASSNIAWGNSADLLFSNPALLAEFKGIGLIAGYQNLFSQSFLNHSIAGVAYDSGKMLGNFGLTTTSLNTTSGASSLASETAIGLHYGAFLMKDRLSSLALGATVNILQISYGKSAGLSGDGSDGVDLGSTTEMGIDIGLVASLGKKHRAAVLVKNINEPAIGSAGTITPLPQVLIGGFAYSPVEEVTTTFSLNYISGYPVEFHGGLEYRLNTHYSILTGLQSQPNRLSAGMKINTKGITMEYGVITHPVLPLTHAISLSVHLKGFSK
ncbi:MAG: hypothetical protein U9Q77_04585 [Candidatus Marinimicrobia bacterium]|nr:hypothetical protein [Candidatus Neomarinimicrobiota bacterium]